MNKNNISLEINNNKLLGEQMAAERYLQLTFNIERQRSQEEKNNTMFASYFDS